MSSTTSTTSAAVTLQNCDSEPIHIPGAIQPSGALLAVDRHGLLAYASENAADALGVTLPLGKPFDVSALDAHMRERIEPWLNDFDPDFEPFAAVLAGKRYDVIGHRNSNDVLIVELEYAGEFDKGLASSLGRAYQTIEKLRRQRSIENLLSVAVEELRGITGFDRVMAYRFHTDDSGEVVREARRDDLDDWEGRRYPASDIPAQARRLYIKNTLRLITDAQYLPVPVHASPAWRSVPLDLSASVLRSVSPIHLEYMANMGVRASMSISVVIGGRLWGMIACHHLDTMHVPYSIRMACEVIAQILSTTIASFEAQARAEKMQASMAMINRMILRVLNDDDLLAALSQESPTPADLISHHACLCLWGSGMTVCGGLAPRGDLREVVQALNATKRNTVACASIADEFPALQSILVPYAGMLACRFDSMNDGWLVWLRREQVETLVWGGKPEKQYKVGALGARLTPRGSFAEWREVVRDTSTPWLPEEVGAAESLRDELAQISNSRSADSDRARTALLAMLGHDLRDPLQSISVAAQLLTRSDGKGAKMGERIRTSSNRMQRLISQVLDLSRLQGGLGLGIHPKPCDLAPIVRDLVEETRLANPGVRIDAEIDEHIDVMADGDRIAQVISNLLSNACKHGTLHAPIRVSAHLQDGRAVVNVVNDGAPIPADQREQLFAPFKPLSLGQSRNRSGLGLGLYIAHQIVVSHGGEIEVACDQGTVRFSVTLPAQAGARSLADGPPPDSGRAT